jgi:opacity protein-like surface antigen
MKIRQVVCTVMLLLMAFSLVQAQQYQAGVFFNVGFPQKEFKENIENNGYGLSGYFLYNFPYSPISIGAAAKYLIYGRESRREPLIPPVYVDVTTTNSIFMGELMIRLQPPEGYVLPYIDGLMGFSYLTTDTKIEDEDDWDDEPIATSKIFDDLTFSYGIGYGIQFCLYKNPDVNNLDKDLMAVYLDIGGQYLKGGIAQYLKEGSIEIDENDNVTYKIEESATDISILKIGVSFAFR